MRFETLGYAVADGVATVTLRRLERLNAMNPTMLSELLELFDRIDADDDVRAVIVTGEGKAFCAGADISDGVGGFKGGQGDGGGAVERDGGGRLALRIHACLKPVIAAINGAAVGVGATMTLPMDIRLASDTARFGFVFARRGIVPEAASSYFLPRVVGISRALEWCYTGRLLAAAEARAGGLVRDVLPAAELLPTAHALAREIADNTAPVSIALTRQMLWRGLDMEQPMLAHRVDSRAVASRIQSRDAAEGVAAFMEKRPARFQDRVSTDMPSFYPWWEEMKFE